MTYDKVLTALRRLVLERLNQGPMLVTKIAETMSVSRPCVSQHLKALKEAGLVSEVPQGTKRIYRLDPRGFGELRRYLDLFWDDALRAFQAEVERPNQSHDAT